MFYDYFMRCYPAYTVRQIEEDFSMREANNYMLLWAKRQTPDVILNRIEKILCKAHGVKFTSTKNTEDTLLRSLEESGWL